MVTGDKTETVTRIGKTTNIISSYDKFLYFLDPKKLTEAELKKQKKIFKSLLKHESVCAIINGKYFEVIQDFKENNTFLYKKFVRILMRCSCCIFSRIHKNLKRYVIKMVRDFNDKIITLAIGDGANDIEMFNEAHIGVGIVVDPDS